MNNPFRCNDFGQALRVTEIIGLITILLFFTMASSCSGWWPFVSCQSSLIGLFLWISGLGYLCWRILGDGLEVVKRLSTSARLRLLWEDTIVAIRKLNADTDIAEPVPGPMSPGQLAYACTLGFMVTAIVAAGGILNGLALPYSTFGAIVLILYDATIVAVMGYIWWLDRSTDPQEKQNAFLYPFFLVCSVIPWTTKDSVLEETFIMTGLALVLLFAAFYQMAALRVRIQSL